MSSTKSVNESGKRPFMNVDGKGPYVWPASTLYGWLHPRVTSLAADQRRSRDCSRVEGNSEVTHMPGKRGNRTSRIGRRALGELVRLGDLPGLSRVVL